MKIRTHSLNDKSLIFLSVSPHEKSIGESKKRYAVGRQTAKKSSLLFSGDSEKEASAFYEHEILARGGKDPAIRLKDVMKMQKEEKLVNAGKDKDGKPKKKAALKSLLHTADKEKENGKDGR